MENEAIVTDNLICSICGQGPFKNKHAIATHKQWKHDDKSMQNHLKGAKARWSRQEERDKQSKRIHVAMESGAKEAVSKTMKERWNKKHDDLRLLYQKDWSEEAKAFCNSKEGALSILVKFDHRPTVNEIKEKIGLDTMSLYRAIYSFDLKEYIDDSTCKSAGENEIRDFIESLGFKTRHDRKEIGRELDVYVESKSLAIEYDGMYWHLDKFISRTSHLEKTEMCEEAGIRLIHVFEWQWDESKDKVKSLIHSALGLDEVIYARNTKFKRISVGEAKKFLDDNHLQGYAASSLQYGLVFDDELVAVMTFGRPRFKNFDGVELVRFATKSGLRIVGGESKLFKNAVRDAGFTSVMSYCDRSKFTGSGYAALGFTHVRDTAPSYWWVRVNEHIPRYRTQMKDEDRIMRGNGYNRFYDCGNAVYEWRSDKKMKTEG